MIPFFFSHCYCINMSGLGIPKILSTSRLYLLQEFLLKFAHWDINIDSCMSWQANGQYEIWSSKKNIHVCVCKEKTMRWTSNCIEWGGERERESMIIIITIKHRTLILLFFVTATFRLTGDLSDGRICVKLGA